MKNIILLFGLLLFFIDCIQGQTLVDSSHISIYKKDTMVWLEYHDELFLNRQNGYREKITIKKPSKWLQPFNADTVQVVINTVNQNESQKNRTINAPIPYKKHDQYVLYSGKYCTFINGGPFGTTVLIFKKASKTLFGKKSWSYLGEGGFAILRSRKRSSYNSQGESDDLINITLLDWNNVRAEYGNGLVEIYTYDTKTDKFEVETIKNEAKK
jgi:hypothetical protein